MSLWPILWPPLSLWALFPGVVRFSCLQMQIHLSGYISKVCLLLLKNKEVGSSIRVWGFLNLNGLLWFILVLYYYIYYYYIYVTCSILGDVVYSESVKCVKTYFYNLFNILIFIYIHFPLIFICEVYFFCLSEKIVIS